MLQKVMKDLRGGDIVARDGAIGSVRDAYFDDDHWAVRYLVVDTGNWLPGRQVLISPASVAGIDDGRVRVDLSRDQVERAPGAENQQPVSRLYEESHALYYGYPYYWAGPHLWGPVATPLSAPPTPTARTANESREITEAREQALREAEQSHLRSSAEVVGYQIQATDGTIGHVADFLVDDRSWAIADMVVDTRNWLPGKTVRVAPSAIEQVDWSNKQVRVRMTRDQIKQSEEV
jgi:uncharacterized protein YrrD